MPTPRLSVGSLWVPRGRACGLVLLTAALHAGTAAQMLPATGARALARADSGEAALLRMPLPGDAQVVYQARPWQAPETPAAAWPAPRASLGLEFKTTRPTDGVRGVVRVQLSGHAFLQARPRGGGLVVSYRSQF